MLNEPARSPYDWQFFFLGFHVRVAWLFWVVMAAIGYEWAQSIDTIYSRSQLETPGPMPLLAIWVGVGFVSILLHELGHSLAMKYYGISSYIVLYHFGGLAIPDRTYGAWRGSRRHNAYLQNIVISAAGPGIQIVLGLIIFAVATFFGCDGGVVTEFLEWWKVPLPATTWHSNAAVEALIDAGIQVNILWALFNLLPVLPLDGGNITRNIIAWNRRTSGDYEASVISIVVCMIGIFYGVQIHSNTLVLMAIALGVMNYQSLQQGGYGP